MDMQALFNGMSQQWQRERAQTQMTLGQLIAELQKMPERTKVANLHTAHSYRGYYVDLAFEKSDGLRLAADLLNDCKSAMGQVFEGYKGGEYVMGALTPVWIADYGSCGLKLIALHPGGQVETAED